MMRVRIWLLAGILALGAGVQAYPVLAQLQPNINPSTVASSFGITPVDRTANAPFFLFEAPPGTDPLALTMAMNADPRVVWAEEDFAHDYPEHNSSTGGSIAAIFDPVGTYIENSDAFNQVRSVALKLTQGTNIRVGVIDTGLSSKQPKLWQRVVAFANVIDNSRSVDELPALVDSNTNGLFDEALGHGTMVAGIVTMLAPNSRLVIAKAADSDGRATTWSLVKGIAFCVNNGVRVINISFGSQDGIPGLNDILDWTEAKGVLVVAPTGNSNRDRSLYPARSSAAIGVSGLNPTNTKAPFSNYDSHCDVAAPATGIRSAWWTGGTGIWSGTSFAAPIVAGGIAGALGQIGPRTNDEVRDALILSGTNIDPLNPNYEGELGRLLNVDRLLTHLRGRKKR